jgi:hypothetical protein
MFVAEVFVAEEVSRLAPNYSYLKRSVLTKAELQVKQRPEEFGRDESSGRARVPLVPTKSVQRNRGFSR